MIRLKPYFTKYFLSRVVLIDYIVMFLFVIALIIQKKAWLMIASTTEVWPQFLGFLIMVAVIGVLPIAISPPFIMSVIGLVVSIDSPEITQQRKALGRILTGLILYFPLQLFTFFFVLFLGWLLRI